MERGEETTFKEMGADEQRSIELLRERVLAKLSFAPDAETAKRYHLDEENISRIDDTLKAVGGKSIETQLSTNEDLAHKKERLDHSSENMLKGAFARLDTGDAGPTGGYYGGYDKEGDFHSENVDIERWARKTLNKKEVDPREQSDLLKGFFATELAQGMTSKGRFKGEGAFKTLELIARVEEKQPRDVALEHKDLFKKLREESTDKKEFDERVTSVNLLWDEEKKDYI